jgi:hypothetical protein
VRAGYAPGQVLRVREDGFIVGTTLDNALWDCEGWPCAIYEVEMEQADLYPMGEILLKTLALRILRVVPPEDAFGPRGAEIVGFMDALGRFPWLAPPVLPDLTRVDALVSEHYALLGGYALVKPCPVRIVDDWRTACRADIEAAKSRTETYVRIQRAIANHLSNDEFLNRRNALGRVLVRRAYGRLWEAAWDRAYAAFLPTTMAKVPQGNAPAARREWAKIRRLVTDRRDADRRGATKAILQQFTPDLSDEDEDDDDDDDCGEVVANGAAMPRDLRQIFPESGRTMVPIDAWNFSVTATTEAFRTIGLLLAAPERPIPSKPLLELYRMGLWPVGETKKNFVVFVPPSAA